MDERRTVKLGETYRSFADVERRVVPIISKCLEGMVTAAKAVDQRKVGLEDDTPALYSIVPYSLS
jgi:hypothetical protein